MTRTASLILLVLSGCADKPREEVCAVAEATLPPAFAAWQSVRPVMSATAIDRLHRAVIQAGESVDLQLHPDGEVAYATLPQGAGEAESFGGMARFRVDAAGLYQVGMSAAAWVDVSRDGQPAPAAAFGPGPRCTPVRKVVSFELSPGDYTLEISGNQTPEIRVMVSAER